MPKDPKKNKEILDQEFAKVQTKAKDLEAKKKIAKDKGAQIKTKSINELFQIMQEAGVDMSNIESIRTFLKNLYERDPDLLEMFEDAFNGVTGFSPEQAPSQAMPPGAMPPGGMPAAPGGPAMPPNGPVMPPTGPTPQGLGTPPGGGQGPQPGLMDKFNNLSGQVMRGK